MRYDNRITGAVIREFRLQKGMTQEVLSGLAGLSRSHLAEIESGVTSPTVDTLWRICEALNTRVSVMMGVIEERH